MKVYYKKIEIIAMEQENLKGVAHSEANLEVKQKPSNSLQLALHDLTRNDRLLFIETLFEKQCEHVNVVSKTSSVENLFQMV